MGQFYREFATRRNALRPRPAKIVEVAAEVFETTPGKIRSGHGTVERRVVASLGSYEAMSRLGAIGAVLHRQLGGVRGC